MTTEEILRDCAGKNGAYIVIPGLDNPVGIKAVISLK